MSASATASVPQAASASARPASNVTGWRRHYLLLVLLLVYGMSMIDRQIMGVLIDLGVPMAWQIVAMSLTLVAISLVMIPVARAIAARRGDAAGGA